MTASQLEPATPILDPTMLLEAVPSAHRNEIAIALLGQPESLHNDTHHIFWDNFFACPLALTPSMDAYSGDSFVNLSVAVSVLLVNLALNFHFNAAAVNGGIISEERYKKALSFYHKAEATLDRISDESQNLNGRALIDLLHMIIRNNRAQIAHALTLYDECQVQLDRLVMYMTHVTTEDYDLETSKILEWYMVAFLWNAIALKPPIFAPAA